MDPQSIYSSGGTFAMPYTHCKTSVVNLVDLDIPEDASEAEYRDFYTQLSHSQIPVARALTDAICSVSLGIAPPVAFPTETVYGLGADATNRAAVAGIFAAKGRPSDNPLIVHVASQEHLERLLGEPIPSIYSDLVKEYWPGPLTILIPVPKTKSVFAENVHPGQQTIGFRVPESKFGRFFIAATGKPIAAPSANSSGKPSPTTAQHVMDDLKGKINFILDGGSCDVGVESTVVDGLHDPPLILRPGGLSGDDLIAHGRKHRSGWADVAIGYKQAHDRYSHGVNDDGAEADQAPRAPGMKYKHYAPQGKMVLLEGPGSLARLRIELDALIDALRPHTNGAVDDEDGRGHGDCVTAITTPAPAAAAAAAATTRPAKSVRPLTIAVITTTSWPPFANLPVEAVQPALNNPHDNDDTNSSTTITTTAAATTRTYRDHHTIVSLPLGTTPHLIARSLFAALRACDDLACHLIFAEAPTSPSSFSSSASSSEVVDDVHYSSNNSNDNESKRGHEYDAILERMRKAATVHIV